VGACVVVLSIVLVVRTVPPARVHGDATGVAHAAIDDFFDRYVTADGRVVRVDQGGDTVSEGQGYALLLALADDDRGRFDRVWRWTAEHLQRPDGLFSWHWEDGHVVDPMPAADADLDIARALATAARRFGDPALGPAAVRVASAVLTQETVASPQGLLLVAGPWARGTTGTADGSVVNPSYFAPRAYAALAAATGDTRWDELDASSDAVLDALSTTSLPPDWATVDGGALHPSPSPGGVTPGYRQDAARIPVRFAEACDPVDRARAARLWPRLRGARHRSTLGLVAAAAAAAAAGDSSDRDRLLDRAQASERTTPTYYGAAWLALGRVMLTTRLLGSCR
jgi:endoglucanase